MTPLCLKLVSILLSRFIYNTCVTLAMESTAQSLGQDIGPMAAVQPQQSSPRQEYGNNQFQSVNQGVGTQP